MREGRIRYCYARGLLNNSTSPRPAEAFLCWILTFTGPPLKHPIEMQLETCQLVRSAGRGLY
jgi:hypothetical protein